MRILKNLKSKQVAHTVVITPGMRDRDDDVFDDSEQGLSNIEDASYEFMKDYKNGVDVYDEFHKADKTMKREDFTIVENHIAISDYKVDLHQGTIEPHAILMAREVDGIIKKNDGSIENALNDIIALLKTKLEDHKVLRKELKLKKSDSQYKIIRKGSWMQAAQFHSQGHWDKVQDGTFRAVSIEGHCGEDAYEVINDNQ